LFGPAAGHDGPAEEAGGQQDDDGLPEPRQAELGEIRDLNPWGAVFGIRNAINQWTFYLQENCVITVARLCWKLGKWEERTFTQPLQLRQFDPGANGHTIKQRNFTFA
jgi:hypothetical protein